MLVVRSNQLRPGLRLISNAGCVFGELEVVSVTAHTIVVRGRVAGRESWSKPFRCRDRGVTAGERCDGFDQLFRVTGFDWLLVGA
jgi:hypothetical protein